MTGPPETVAAMSAMERALKIAGDYETKEG